ncbi:MAG: peptidase M28 family protein, partial [Thermoanaerobaculia bacterium]
MIDHVLANSKAWDHISHLTDAIGPRLSGSRNADRAVQWTTQQFRSWGIDVRQEKVMVPHWIRGAERAHLVSHHNQSIVLTALGGSVATPASGMTADVIEVTSYEQLEQLGRENIRGKIVFYNKAMNMSLVESGRAFEAYGEAVVFRGTGASRAAEYGAV